MFTCGRREVRTLVTICKYEALQSKHKYAEMSFRARRQQVCSADSVCLDFFQDDSDSLVNLENELSHVNVTVPSSLTFKMAKTFSSCAA